MDLERREKLLAVTGTAPPLFMLIEISLGRLGEGKLAGGGKVGGLFGGLLIGQGIDAISQQLACSTGPLSRFR